MKSIQSIAPDGDDGELPDLHSGGGSELSSTDFATRRRMDGWGPHVVGGWGGTDADLERAQCQAVANATSTAARVAAPMRPALSMNSLVVAKSCGGAQGRNRTSDTLILSQCEKALKSNQFNT